MKKGVLTLVLLFTASHAIDTGAAIRAASAPVKILDGGEPYFMHPVWSPDGTAFAFTSSNYHGLWIMWLGGRTSEPVQLSNDPAAGFGFAWSNGGEAIVTRVARYDQRRRTHALKIIDVTRNTSRLLTDFRGRMPGLPHWLSDDRQVYLFNGSQLEFFHSGLASHTVKKGGLQQWLPHLQNGKIEVRSLPSGEATLLDPVEGARYINLVMSPDQTKLAFEVVGGDLYVMNTDGSGLVDLGPGNRPQWSPDGHRLVYMITEDDGHRFTRSDLFVVRVDGTEKVNLTHSQNTLEMNPNWSPDGKTILFDSYLEGAIYRLEIDNR